MSELSGTLTCVDIANTVHHDGTDCSRGQSTAPGTAQSWPRSPTQMPLQSQRRIQRPRF